VANPTYRASTTAHNIGGLSLSISSPSSTAIGDVLTVVYTGRLLGTYSPTPVLPSGWTLLNQDIQTGNGYTVHTYTARFVATAAGAKSFTFSSSTTGNGGRANVALVCCYNQDSTTPIDDSQVAAVPNGTTATSPAATATVANDLILCVYVENGNTGAVPSLPSGLTSAVSYQDSTNATGIRVGYASLASSGTTPTYTSTFGTTVNPSSGVFGTTFTVLVKAASTSGVSASAAQVDGADSQAASGTITVPAQAAQADGADSQAAAGAITTPAQASAAQADGTDSQAASGTITVPAQAAQADGADSQAAAGTLTVTVQATQADGADSQAAAATLTVTAQATQTDGTDSQAASGTLTVTAQATQTDGTDSQAASGALTIVAQVAQTDGADTQTALGAITASTQATAVQADSADTQAASGTLTVTVQAAQTDGADNQAASGTLTVTVQATQTDGADTQTASGTLTIIAQAAQIDGVDSQAASGTLTIIVQTTQVDSADTQAANGVLGISIVAVQADSADTQSALAVPNPPIIVTGVQVNGADVQVASLNFNYNTLNEAYLYASQQAATPQFYTMSPPPQANTAVYTQSGTFTVPAYSNYFLVSATAAGGSPYGAAGRQTSRQSLPVTAGDVLTVSISPNVTVQRGSQTLLSLLDGAAYAKGTQGGLPQDSGIVGLGSGVDEGVPFPAALVFIWN